MNSPLKLFLTLVSLLLSYSILGQVSSTESISSLDWMIGKWNIIATEKVSDGGSFRESGFQECSWVLNNKVIRCDRFVLRLESSGRYAKGPKSRSSITYVMFNKNKQNFELIRIRSNGSSSHIYKKKDDYSLESEWSFIHPELGFELFINSSFSRINNDYIKEVEILKNSEGTFTERYESKIERIE